MNKLINFKTGVKVLMRMIFITRYNKGRAPAGYPGWPYNNFGVSHDVVVRNIQGQLDGISNAFKQPEPDTSDDSWSSQSGASADELSSSGDSSAE